MKVLSLTKRKNPADFEKNFRWLKTYDFMNRLTAVQDPSQAVTAYYYDSYGNMTRMTDGNSNSTYYYFDNGNRLTRVTDPLSRNTNFAYDAAGNMTSRTDAKSQTTTLSYDVLNRLTSKSGADTVSYAYDDGGRRTSMTDSIGTTTYSYNTVNQLTSTTVPGNKTISYAYNSVGSLTSRTDAGGVDTTFEYDNGNRLTRTTRATRVMTYGYDDANRPTNKTYPNGIQGQFSYDNANQLTTASYLNGGTPFWSCQYAYDSLGNRTSKVIGATTLTYLYDIDDRLTCTRVNGNTQTVYEYDNVGNRTRKIFMGTPTVYGYDAANQMTSSGPTTYGYDNNGNRTSSVTGGQTTTYAYDGVDRLTRITYPQAGNPYNTFEYNGDGLRVKMRAKTGAITRFVWSGSDVINEYSDNWTLQKSYYLGGGLEGQIAGTTYSYYHQDGLGSVVTVTNPSGNVTDSYDYDDFGTQIFNQGTTQNVYRYTGQQSDADSALLYLRARYYEPSTGRFITRDPVSGTVKEPSTYNLYMYCKNNPLKFIDPSGYWAWEYSVGKKQDDPAVIRLISEEGDKLTTLKGFPTDNMKDPQGKAGVVYNVTDKFPKLVLQTLGKYPPRGNCGGFAWAYKMRKNDTDIPFITPAHLLNQYDKKLKFNPSKVSFGDSVFFGKDGAVHVGIFLSGTSMANTWILSLKGAGGQVTIERLRDLVDYGRPTLSVH